jgi:hypothetical protein
LEEAEMFRSRIVSKSVTAGLLSALIVAALVPAAASAAPSPLRFNVLMGEGCISGVASADSPGINLMWTGQDGSYKLDAAFLPNPDGTFSTCSFLPVTVEAGDRIYADDGVSTHELIVPQLTLFQNRVNDVYKGRGPAGQYIKLISAIGWEFASTFKVRVNSQGQWSFRPGWDVRGRQSLRLSWKSGAGDVVAIRNVSPYLDLTIGLAKVSGSGRAGSAVTVVNKNGSTLDVRGTAMANASPLDGTFSGQLRKGNNKVKVQVGNIITSTIASDADFVVPNISATAYAPAMEISGHCPGAGYGYEYSVMRNGSEVDWARWFTDEEGSFVESSDGLQYGDRVLVGCELESGDWVRKWVTAS